MKDETKLQTEIKLHNSSYEREKYDNLADLYAILVALEHLERAYIKDSVTPDEYTPECKKLLAQYKTALNIVKDEAGQIQEFAADYGASCPAALSRVGIGVPATVEHGGMGEAEQKQTAITVAESVQHFITIMDSLRLKMVAVDEIYPLLSDLLDSLNKLTLPASFSDRAKITKWLSTLNGMNAVDELNDEQVRQLLFDLETAHSSFYKSLSHG
eukprot:Clim_evm34s195 gene=Clim_evmTU34s195